MFHHIGFATKNIARTKRIFKDLGLEMGKIIHVPSQKVKVCFSHCENHPLIELIEPAGEDSPVRNILNKVGTSPYHICYQTAELDRASEYLRELDFLLIKGPTPSNALKDNKICFFYNNYFGLIEVVEVKEPSKEE